ncbi:MAG: 50S ribosomal protein L22, partial [Nanoarchaeota archaeon]|nr:50S ribosomal protein L22 [Nanoarchaeota archaeon]
MELKDYNKENMAKVCGKALPISTKKTIVVCDFIRHKNLQKAKELLGNVVKKKIAVPFTRFNKDMGHKKGMGAGRFPVKTSKEMILLLESAEANAQFKGLNTSSLV